MKCRRARNPIVCVLLKGAVTYLFDKKRIAIFLHSKIWLPFSVDRNTTGVMHKYYLIIRSKELSGLLSQKTGANPGFRCSIKGPGRSCSKTD